MCQAHVDVASFLELFAPKQNEINYMAVLHAFNGASKKLDNKVLFQIKHPCYLEDTRLKLDEPPNFDMFGSQRGQA